MTRDHRRLAAIVSVDAAGYSRLMGLDDSGTLAALKAHRRELIDPKISEYGGRIVKTTGDGLLLEFPSVVDAVRCAADVQHGMAERNEGIAPDRRLDFRIGINVGDIIIDDDDIFGDGVNVAARLEALADPGGICVSRVVRDQVLDKLSFTFEDLGAQHVKNIAHSVDVYRVDLRSGAPHARSLGQNEQNVLVPYRFGSAEVRPVERKLLIDGRPAAIGARAFDVLLALVERRERFVTKNELLDLVWPGLVVEEKNLQVQISTLRKLLGAQAIATIPGRGYRFALPLDGVPQVSATPAVPPVRAAEGASTTNLPDGLPHLFGRDKEIGEIVQLLAQYRLVTIVGAGGIGKTCLGQVVAHEMRGRFDDGVWLIELAALNEPARVAGTVAHALNMPVSDESYAFDAAIDAVRGKQLLLVLDNCEHLLGAVSTLAAAIRRDAPGTTLLATSQEPLKVADEHVYRLGTLAVPLPGAVPNADAATAYGAVALFVARAQAADQRFALNEHNVDAVLDICCRLDGIALALELAAARVPLLGVELLRSRLDERFNLLTGGARTALRRHQTLRAALEWSHALLSGAERTVFRRLGAFVGGFAFEAAQQVAGDATMDAWEVLDHLGALVDKSFVVADAGDPPRYRLLETGRAYALERLVEAGETEALARRHAQMFTALFETSFAERWQARPADHFARYRPELDNLRAALNWSSRHDPLLEVRLAGAAAWLWSASALRAEGIAACERAISHLHATTPPALEARVLSELAQVGEMGVIAVHRALQALERAIALYRGLNDRVGLYLALARQASFLEAAGDTAAAGSALAQMQSLEEPAWPPRLQLEGLFALNTGSVEQFRALQEERCRLARLAEDELEELLGLKDLVYTDMMLGRFGVAIRDSRELAERFRRRGFASHVGYVLADLSVALTLNGELDEAVHVLREAVPQLRHAGVVWRQLALFALIAFLRGRKDSAARLLGAEEVVFEKSGHRRIWDEQRTHDEVSDRLQQAFAPDLLARLMREGARMQEKGAVALALRELESIDA